jgi:DNA-binding CsgD family transcriptional regulator
VFEQAVCRWRLGEALLGADRRDEAAVELRAAADFARGVGATPLLDMVTQAARRARITLRADETEVRDEIDPFTPRERSVLGLVALGRTNREVGEELYISEKTVSVHLTRIMAKLGAGRRAEAVAIAYDRGLLEQPTMHDMHRGAPAWQKNPSRKGLAWHHTGVVRPEVDGGSSRGVSAQWPSRVMSAHPCGP